MKLRSNLVAFVFIIAGIGIVIFSFASLFQDRLPVNELVKKDEPMPTSLHPQVEEAKEKLIVRAKEKGIPIVITDGHRSAEEQNRLYEQGRSKEGNIVTHVKGGESYHNYGLAVDFALKLNNGDVVWDMERDGNKNGQSDWMEVVAVAKDLGFEWGGDWTGFKDYPHLEMNFGLTIRELQYGQRPKDTAYAEN